MLRTSPFSIDCQARDVNIFPPEESGEEVKAFEGREFFHLPESKQLEMLKADNIVFCRAEPSDKQKLVKMLQSLHEIPAMTGDGKQHMNSSPSHRLNVSSRETLYDRRERCSSASAGCYWCGDGVS